MAPSVRTAITTLQGDPWMRGTEAVAEELFDSVIELLHGALDTPVTYRALLTLHTQLAPLVLTSKSAPRPTSDDREYFEATINACVTDAQRQLESAEIPAHQSQADKDRLEQGVFKYRALKLYRDQGQKITFAQLLEMEYGVILRPLTLYWTL